jgi:hypothetical protein
VLTSTGAVILLLAGSAMLRSSWTLLAMLVFSIPFSATSIVNFGDKNGLPPSLFLAVLYILRIAFDRLMQKKIWPVQPLSSLLFFVFFLALVVSLMTPFLNNGYRFDAVDPAGGLKAEFQLAIGAEVFKQLAYFVLWFLVVIFSVVDLRTELRCKKMVRVGLISALFVSLWGWMQVALSVLGLPYPHSIFNNTANPSGQGYSAKIEGFSISRMSSVSTEPSTFAAFVLICAAIVLGFLLQQSSVFSKKRDLAILFFLVVTALASTAATGYLGVVFLVFLGVLTAIFTGRVQSKLAVFSGLMLMLVLSSAVIGYGLSDGFRAAFDQFVFGKRDSFSFAQRYTSTQFALDEFQKFPLIGLGIGAMTVYSLPFWLLANTGVFGFFSFGLFYLSLFTVPSKLLGLNREGAGRGFGQATLFALIMLGFLGFLTGFPYVFGYFWWPIMLSFNANAFLRGNP